MGVYNYAGKTVCLSTDFLPSNNANADGKIYLYNDAGVETTALTVTVVVPAGMTLVPGSANPSLGTFDDGSLEWSIPNPGIASGDVESLNLCFTLDDDTAEALVVSFTAAIDSGLESDTSDNTGSSILCGIPCVDVVPCLNISDYISFGSNILVVSGSGTASDPFLINAVGGSNFPSADSGNLLSASINDNGYFLDAQTVIDAIEAEVGAPILGTH